MVLRMYNGESAYSKKEEEMCTSLYQLLYCRNGRGAQNIDCSSHCQIKNVSKPKPFVFCFVCIFFRQFFVRSKKTLLCFLLKMIIFFVPI